MYRQWPFFRSTIDLMEMALAKATRELRPTTIVNLVGPELHDLGRRLRARRPAPATGSWRSPDTPGCSKEPRAEQVNPSANQLSINDQPHPGRLLRRLRQAAARRYIGRSRGVALRRALLVTINGLAAGDA